MQRFAIAASFIAVILTLWSPGRATAQAVDNATIHGQVTDPSGAVVPGARVKATKIDTQQILTTVTGGDGSYVLPNLPVGPYTIEVSAPAFNNYVQSGVVLQVGNNVQINVALRVGAASQTVEIAANVNMVETQDTSISDVIDRRRIIDLPLNGRQATDLILLSGDAVLPPTQSKVVTSHSYTSAVAVSVAGGQINGNNFLLDGADHNDSHSNVNIPYPFPDALQEFSVQTNGVSARYGLHPGSVVNAVTKSGTNQFHGNLFEFVRNGAFNARNFFAPTQDSLRRNQFGGTIGGPIRKNKLFLFSGFQATRTRTAPPQTIAFVQTPSALNGDLSTLESAACQSNGRARVLTDPATGQPFPGNFISPTRFSAPAVALFKYIPVSNDPCGQLTYALPNPSNENQYTGRADWLLNEKHTVFARYFIADYANPPYFTGNILTTTRSGINNRAQSIVLGENYTISPTTINSLRGDFSRMSTNRSVPDDMPSPVKLGVNMFNFSPNFIALSVSSHFSMGGGSNAPAYFNRNQIQFADDFDMIRGRHHIIVGGNFINIQLNETNIFNGNGVFTFNGALTNDPLADFLIGRPSAIAVSNPEQEALRQKYVGLYAQDDFQVNKKLNVHVGVRWEPLLSEHDVAGRGSHFSEADFIAGNKTSQYTNAPPGLFFYGDPGIPAAYAGNRYLDFAPRVGLVWDPTGSAKQTIRTSYGIFFDTPENYQNALAANAPPWGNQVSLNAPAGGFANPFLGFPGGNPFPTPNPPPKNQVFVPQGVYINLPLNLHHTYMQQWSVSVQRQMGANWLASVTYLGNKSTHLYSSRDQNYPTFVPGASTLANLNDRRLLSRLNPTAGSFYSTIGLLDDGVNTNYNAVRLSVQHRFSHNFSILSNYTYSHCLMDAETQATKVATSSVYQNPNNRNADYGNCAFDLRQNFINSVVYQAPKFKNPWTNTALSNWQLGFVVSVHSGFWFTPLSGVDTSLIAATRPNIVADPYVRNTKSLAWIAPAAFVPTSPGAFGNAGANSLLGPAYFGMDTNLTRIFKIRENQRVELRFEFFNITNHVNFNTPVNSLSSATFGKIQSAADPRVLQFALKYAF